MHENIIMIRTIASCMKIRLCVAMDNKLFGELGVLSLMAYCDEYEDYVHYVL